MEEQSKAVIVSEPGDSLDIRCTSRPGTLTTDLESTDVDLGAGGDGVAFESRKMTTLTAKLSKIAENSRKRIEHNSATLAQAKESIGHKMKARIDKCEAYLSEAKSKVLSNLDSLDQSVTILGSQANQVRSSVEEKLKAASAQRDENIRRMLNHLREHNEKVNKVRANFQEKVKALESQILCKLQLEQKAKDQLKMAERRLVPVPRLDEKTSDEEGQSRATD